MDLYEDVVRIKIKELAGRMKRNILMDWGGARAF